MTTPDFTPEALQAAYDKIESGRLDLLFEAEGLPPMAEQHLLMSMDLFAAGLRALKLAKYHMMQKL